MNDVRPWRLTVLVDPADAFHVALADRMIRHAPADCTVDMTPAGDDVAACAEVPQSDVVVVLDPGWLPALADLRRDTGCAATLVVILDDRFPRNDPRFEQAYRIADGVLFENESLWRRLGCPGDTFFLPPFLDASVFDAISASEDRGHATVWLLPAEADFPTRYEAWLAGPQEVIRDTEFAHSLVAFPMTGSARERAEAFRRAAVVVCTAETLDARRHAREALACGCTVVVTRQVNEAALVVDGITGVEVEADAKAMLQALRDAHARRAALLVGARAAQAAGSWQFRADALFAVLRGWSQPLPRVDLTDQVTVFVSTVGAVGFDACMAHLERQDCRFRLEVIDRVAPMSAAFQQMLDRCRTPWYVQVDEDMMLYRDAVRRMHACIVASPENVSVAIAYLHDTFLEFPIQGVKIFRHDVVRRYPLADVRSCEMDQQERMRRDGWRTETLTAAPDGKVSTPPLGLHDLPRDPRTIYERFRTLELARRQHRRRLKYLERWPAMFVERYLRDADPLDAHALLGMLSARMITDAGQGHEKDFRAYGDLPGLAEAIAFIGQAGRSAPRD